MIPNQTNNANVQPLFGSAEAASEASEGEWMSVQEASNATGLSMGTIRRYIKIKKIKSRRLSKHLKSKLEVLVTKELLPDEQGSVDYFGTDSDEDDGFDEGDQHDQQESLDPIDHGNQSAQTTMAWLRQKLDEKDRLLQEKDAKIDEKDARIDELAHELTSAYYRNGYLESERTKFEEKILLLEDKSKQLPTEAVEVTGVTAADKPAGSWSWLLRFLTGR